MSPGTSPVVWRARQRGGQARKVTAVTCLDNCDLQHCGVNQYSVQVENRDDAFAKSTIDRTYICDTLPQYMFACHSRFCHLEHMNVSK